MAWRTALLAKMRAMDWFRGLRAATAISAPMFLGYFLKQPEMGWAALGGFEAILSDRGGPYRSRVAMLGTLTLGGSVGLMLGALVGGHLTLALPVTLVWCFAWSYLMVMGQPFSSASPLVQVIFLCGLGAPTGSLTMAAARAAYLLAGCAWAILLSLFLWPVDPYRPARFAVAGCYEGLASFLVGIHDLSNRRQHPVNLWHRLARHHQSRLRGSLEAARFAVVNVRSRNALETLRERNLLVLLESADLLLARTVALADAMEATVGKTDSTCTVNAKNGLLAIAQVEAWIGELLRRRLKGCEQTSHHWQAGLQRIVAEMSYCMESDDGWGRFLLHQITDVEQNLETALNSAVAIWLGRDPRSGEQTPASLRDRNPPQKLMLWLQLQYAGDRLQQLAANWSWKSLLLRHAARVALVCGIGVAIMTYRHIDHGYWIPLTSVIVLQPHVSVTFRKSLQRIGGTVSGGILAAILSVYLHTQLALAITLFPLAFFCLAVLPVSYALFSFFLTPTFVLAFLPHLGDWQVAGLRIMNTALGALIAMLAMATIWPALERQQFGKLLQRSLEANRKYITALAQHWASYDRPSTGDGHRALALARRATGLALNDAEEALDRLATEPPLPGRASLQATEAATTFVTYLRRFTQSVTTLTSMPGEGEWKKSAETGERLAQVESGIAKLQQEMDSMRSVTANAVGHPAPLFHHAPPTATDNKDSSILELRQSGQRQLARLDRQMEVLWRGFHAMQSGRLFPNAEEPERRIPAGSQETRHP